MKFYNTILVSFFLFIFSVNVNAQSENKDVTITASGSGKTLEEAKQSALRSATEQAFGAFISSKTEMFNDQVVADQMASVSSGNIKSYEVLNEAQLPDGRWGVTLKVLVSIDKLTSFVQAKGISVEVKGGLFVLNIKQQMLNEEGEVKVICEMIGMLHEPMQSAFDYTIKSSNPKSLDTKNENWEIPLEVSASANKNFDICRNYLFKTLESLSLSPTELETYKNLNKKVFQINIKHKGDVKSFYLRKKISFNAILAFFSNWSFYIKNFSVMSGNDISYGFDKNGDFFWDKYDYKMKALYHPKGYDWLLEKLSIPEFFLLNEGELAAVFKWKDKRTLYEIENISKYLVVPRGVISKFNNGGYVVKEPVSAGFKIGLSIDNDNKINFLEKDYPAITSGIKIGDKILRLNGSEFQPIELMYIINRGKNVKLLIEREGNKLEFIIKPIFFISEKGLVVSLCDLVYDDIFPNIPNSDSANKICKSLILNSYRDWIVPSAEQMKILKEFSKLGIGNLKGFYRGNNDPDHIGDKNDLSIAYAWDFSRFDTYSLSYTTGGFVKIRAVRNY